MTEDDYKDKQKDIKDTARKFISSLDRDTAKALCATEDTVSEYLKLMTIQSVVEDKIAETADREVSDEEARQVSVSWASFPKEGNYTVSSGTDETETEDISGSVNETEPDTENTSESVSETEPDTENVIGDETETETGAETDIAGEEAEAFLKSIPDADGFDTAFHEFTEKYAESPVMEDEYTFGADDTYPDSAVVSAAMEAEEDNTLLDSVVEGQDAYYVVLVTDAFDDDATAQKKEEIVSERENTAISEKYAEWEKESDWEVKSDVLSEIKADRRFVAPEEIETDISSSETEAESENGPIVSYAETEPETDVESVAETPGIDDETEADMTEGGK